MAEQARGLGSLARRLGRRWRASRGGADARIDTCWVLTDGSLAVDAWCVPSDGVPRAMQARLVGGSDASWAPLLPKARPDVAEHLRGPGAARSDVGLVGVVGGPVPSGGDVAVELRGDGVDLRLPAGQLRRDAVPEEVFTGVVVDEMTPAALEPLVAVARYSARPDPPTSEVAYAYGSASVVPVVGVVVPVYGQSTYVRNLLRALADARDAVELTVVCDDPALAPDLVAWMQTWNDAVYRVHVQVVVHDRNAGFAAACNTGWRAASAAEILLLNSDVLVGEVVADLDLLRADLAADGVAAVAPVLLFPDGSLQHAGMELVVPADFPDFVLPGHPGKHGTAAHLPTEPFDVPMLTGAAMLVRRDDLEAVGGVPLVYGRGDFEDVLLSTSLQQRGRLVVDPRVRWTHVEGASYRRAELGGIAVTLAKSVVAGERLGDLG